MRLETRAWGLFHRCCLGSIGLALGACTEPAVPPVAPEVGVVQVVSSTIPLDLVYTARTRGEREIEVRARVSGILKKRYYREGEEVAAGAPLFLIDPAPFRVAVDSAQARLDMEQARLNETQRQFTRAQSLFKSGILSARDHETAEATFSTTQAAVKAAAADLDRARLDLSYTQVRAPISGMTGREARSEGSMVNAGDASSLLTTIAQSDARIYVEFAIPETEARLLRQVLKENPAAVSVRLRPGYSEEIADAARIEFLDTRVRTDTGTVEVRATVDNQRAALAPGQFVQARVAGLRSEPGFYVPARSVMYGADGPFVWRVDERDQANMQAVKVGQGYGNLLRVESGLNAGDRVVVDGVLKVQPQQAVKPLPVGVDAMPAAVAARS